MTPEERWTKIENAIAENNRQIAENWHQIQENNRQIAENSQEIAENSRQIAENSRQIAGTDRQIMRMSAQWETKTTQIDAQIEKNTAAIRDLIDSWYWELSEVVSDLQGIPRTLTIRKR